jgi:subtilisin-like proprotein convertase family protein
MSNYVKTVEDIRKAMFTSIDYGNRRSSSNLELVYGLDGSLAPTTYAGPVLTLRGGSGTQFVSPAVGGGVPVTPLTRDPASPGSFPDGYYIRQAFKRVPASGTNAGYVEDTLNVAQSVTINDLKIFAGFNHLNESAVQLTLYAPSGDSLTFWNLDFQSAYTSGAATIFDDAADSAMDHRYISFIPTVRPHASINTAFGGKNSAGPWRLRMSQLINGFSGYVYGWGLGFNNETLVNVADGATPVPGQYVLSQAYPNPFNPSTTIRFEVPLASHVTLAVFNSIGQRVATLIDGDVPAGVHEVRFDGTRLSSGVYFYRMQSGAFIQTRKVVLVK